MRILLQHITHQVTPENFLERFIIESVIILVAGMFHFPRLFLPVAGSWYLQSCLPQDQHSCMLEASFVSNTPPRPPEEHPMRELKISLLLENGRGLILGSFFLKLF
jgi:hypothetical protein